MSKNLKEIDAIRAEGAELFIQAYLMLEYGIPVSMASRNMPNFDLIAHDYQLNKNCKIQVKYRKAKNNDGSKIEQLDFDFLAFIVGNIGNISDVTEHLRKDDSENEIYVFPKQFVIDTMRHNNIFKVYKNGRYNYVEYKNNFKQIYEFIYA